VHALEMSHDPTALLREIWRVMASGGRLLAVVPNRRGVWARMDTTPFGHGRPYSRAQIMYLLREAWFTPVDWSEALYVPLLLAWTYSSLVVGSHPTPRRAALSGLTAGLTAITRTTTLLAWPLVWTALFLRLKSSSARMRTIAIVIAASLAVFSLIAMRNALVSHRFAPMPTEFGITLRGGNEPPGNLQMSPARKTVYDRLRLDGHTAEVIEYAFAAPGAFMANLGRKALFVSRNWVSRIEGLSERENEVLKPFLFDHQRDPMFQCRFSWRPRSIAFWDNRWAQHYAVPDYTGERRIMQRITIAGPPVV